MHRLRGFGLTLFALFICSGSTLASHGIEMPAGSNVWMLFRSSIIPIAQNNDVVGSNLLGPAPPNGIPMTTVTSGNNYAHGYAEVLPDRVRALLRSNQNAEIYASWNDTYTVEGTASGPFDIQFTFNVTGVMGTVPFSTGHFMSTNNIRARIGTFNTATEDFLEQFRITQFVGSTEGFFLHPSMSLSATPVSTPFDITATYTKTGVNVGDIFDIGYGIRGAFGLGEIDILNTGTVSFVLPEGVTLRSSLAEAIPEPAMLTPALLGALLLARRRPRRA